MYEKNNYETAQLFIENIFNDNREIVGLAEVQFHIHLRGEGAGTGNQFAVYLVRLCLAIFILGKGGNAEKKADCKDKNLFHSDN